MGVHHDVGAGPKSGTDSCFVRCSLAIGWEADMGKGLLLWLIGVPIPVIIVLYLIFHH